MTDFIETTDRLSRLKIAKRIRRAEPKDVSSRERVEDSEM